MILPFLSTLSLRRATTGFDSGTMVPAISIHALLAESDPTMPCTDLRGPRFLSTLSLRRATAALSGGTLSDVDFYPRSPCGERRSEGTTATSRATFLSTLSLRRATRWPVPAEKGSSISIHALLAESDGPRLSSICPTRLFLSTLSLRRATFDEDDPDELWSISIHALLAESDFADVVSVQYGRISIHALLAESDAFRSPRIALMVGFLSTLSLRRATAGKDPQDLIAKISIHALLAESDPQT